MISGALSGVIETTGLPSTASSIVLVPGIVRIKRAARAAASALVSTGMRTSPPSESKIRAPPSCTSRPRCAEHARVAAAARSRRELVASAVNGEMREGDRQCSGRSRSMRSAIAKKNGTSVRLRTLASRASSGCRRPAFPARPATRFEQRAIDRQDFRPARCGCAAMPHPTSCSALSSSTAKARSNNVR